ncbi:hypothetical protein EI94DRAFT_1756369 [Lactarius quietus]|nr:hypothetical protein EI94DRAFT_1756369 [Lactarius quietus]
MSYESPAEANICSIQLPILIPNSALETYLSYAASAEQSSRKGSIPSLHPRLRCCHSMLRFSSHFSKRHRCLHHATQPSLPRHPCGRLPSIHISTASRVPRLRALRQPAVDCPALSGTLERPPTPPNSAGLLGANSFETPSVVIGVGPGGALLGQFGALLGALGVLFLSHYIG